MAEKAKLARRCAVLLALCWSFALHGSEQGRDGPFFPSQATVVLVAGLPGDIESEAAYRDQLQACVEIAVNHAAHRIVILCDAPESIEVPSKTGTKVLQADRKNFQKLSEILAGETNALLVVAWGHGGKQGSVPVFHVRGPRLTPSDFQKLAGSLTATNSSWVLMFRSSGAFAAQLAAPGRLVIASDFEIPFNSDPIGFPLMLQKLRSTPDISFTHLAKDLGKAVAGWYEERHLARTEEPTLWAGTDKPVQLAAGPRIDLSETKPEASGSAPESAARQMEPSDLPRAWKDIAPVPAARYSNADAVILREQLAYTLGNAPAVASERDTFIQVLTPEGKRFGDFDISYDPPFEEIQFLDCEVRRPDGTMTRLDPDEIREGRVESVGEYQFARRKIFSLPGIVPGAILRVRYRTEWQKFPLPHVSMAIPLAHELPALDARLQVTVPGDASFHFVFENLAGADPAIKQSSYGTSYSWTFQNLSPMLPELLASPEKHSQVLISTFPDWPAFTDWYLRISKRTDDVTPEIAARAAQLTRQAANDREKVVSLYDYVAGLRYVAVPLGVNSFRPHAAANVLQNQFGDCKDKANLFNALLHAVKIEAHLVLVPRFSRAYENLPGLAFNHAISQVLLGQETLWLDTTDDVCRFGLLPPGDSGRKVLVLDGESKSLTQLPSSRAEEHQLHLAARINARNPDEPLPLSMKATTRGYPDYELRALARQARERSPSAPILSAKLRPLTGSFVLESQTNSPVAALDQDFSCEAEGNWFGGVSPSATRWVLHSPVWIPKQWELALHRRQGALFLNEGYPLILEEDFQIALPAQAQLESLPTLRENQSGPLRWRIEWARIADDKLSAQFHAELDPGDLSLAATADCQKQLRQLLGALSAGVTIVASPSNK